MGALLVVDLWHRPTLPNGNGHSAWHAARITSLHAIQTHGLVPGPASPRGIYSHTDELNHLCWGPSYCPAVRCQEGIFVKLVLHIAAHGHAREAGEPGQPRHGGRHARDVAFA